MEAIYLEHLINHTNQIIFTINNEGIFEYVSNRWTYQLGHDVSEVIGKHYNIFVHKTDVSLLAEYLSKVAAGENNYSNVEYRIKHKNGAWHWHESCCSYIESKNGKTPQFIGSCTDITEKKAIETSLRAERLKFKLLVENSLDTIFVLNDEGCFSFLSDSKVNFGYEANDLLNVQYLDIVHEDFRSMLFQYQMDLKTGNTIVDRHELLIRHKNGKFRWTLVNGNYIQIEELTAPLFIGVASDIHEQVLERDKITKDLKIFESIFEETLGGHWQLDLKKQSLLISNKLKETIGYDGPNSKYIATKALCEIMDANDYEHFWNDTQQYIKSNPTKPFKRQVKFRHKNGCFLTFIICGIVTERRGKHIDKVIGCLINITELSNIKDQLQKQNEELTLLRYTEQKNSSETAYKIILGQEHERNNIAQNLHDGVSQLLFAAKIQLQESRSKDDLLYKNGISLVEKSINEIKYTASTQNSFLLLNKTLYEGLNELLLSLPQNKIKFNLHINNKFKIRISDNKRIIVFRIIQELIHNILKYSDATIANVHVKKGFNKVSILVTDNGVGFDIINTKKGNGLINLENKLKVIEGKYVLKSQPNKGTLVYINFPITS